MPYSASTSSSGTGRKPPRPPAVDNTWKEPTKSRADAQRQKKDNFCFDLFKDAVYSYIIDREVFTDGVITEAVDLTMEQWSDQISWDDLEYLREEIFRELGVYKRAQHYPMKPSTEQKKSTEKQRSPTSTGSRSSTSSSSAASLSEMKTSSGSKSQSGLSSESEEASDVLTSSDGSQSSSSRSSDSDD
ncbi:unnamed protein product [Nippostrongylus brasiliensis]|uniref:Uncharacterized protein n=1 Tax=Nippostrongylus brasiliensis TaxID=27835 RepID=A0A0N4Y599_NIPBR|nr:unnamed protein product [Nippostrongylus brasiliensis]